MSRIEFISSLIGKPWQANAKGPDAYDCWHLTKYVLQEHFQFQVPTIDVPSTPTWPWMITTFREHTERQNWAELKSPAGSLLVAGDGSICLMARSNQPAHCGVLFRPEDKVLHCSQTAGVVFQDLTELHMEGWAKLRFFGPK